MIAMRLRIFMIKVLIFITYFFIYKESAFFYEKAKICIDEHIFYMVNLNYKGRFDI